jgi:hypothetical protein
MNKKLTSNKSFCSFKEFNDASKKNRRMSLKEIFAKMLLRLKV